MRTSIPNPTSRGIISAHQFNQLIEVGEGATYRGKAHKTTRGVIPRISITSSTIPRSSPYRVHGVNGVQAIVAGSYSASTPYIWINIANNTSEWKSSTLSPFPLDTIILDGRMGNSPEEFWVTK